MLAMTLYAQSCRPSTASHQSLVTDVCGGQNHLLHHTPYGVLHYTPCGLLHTTGRRASSETSCCTMCCLTPSVLLAALHADAKLDDLLYMLSHSVCDNLLHYLLSDYVCVTLCR